MLVVWKLDRLGRNLAHLVNTVQDLSARGVGLRVLAGDGAQIEEAVVGRLRLARAATTCRRRSLGQDRRVSPVVPPAGPPTPPIAAMRLGGVSAVTVPDCGGSPRVRHRRPE